MVFSKLVLVPDGIRVPNVDAGEQPGPPIFFGRGYAITTARDNTDEMIMELIADQETNEEEEV